MLFSVPPHPHILVSFYSETSLSLVWPLAMCREAVNIEAVQRAMMQKEGRKFTNVSLVKLGAPKTQFFIFFIVGEEFQMEN